MNASVPLLVTNPGPLHALCRVASTTVRLVLAVALLGIITAPSETFAGDNPAVWKYQVQGHFDAVLEDMKSGLEAAQFTITGEENLAKALAKNRHVLGEAKWNTIGFQEATAVHFCSLLFNQEVFNIDMDWSILCPFKIVAYTMKAKPEDVTVLLTRPTYVLGKDPHPRANEMGKRIEERIVGAIREALAP